ncbi:hypothetical protein SAMN05216262_102159 [Colwellia chukchiensis]|uniref:Uncharacterized protein n=1 Tax=Colwellia chukchiensis TaxID=641665 RepID=A0A1H7JB96_9GAMM|nr:DUF1289 domain-containing protein [Colwellia chukchiensis]SEK70565.1 hypothetical protein SAMN05216262_102159 [Colwellia chukchiensis]
MQLEFFDVPSPCIGICQSDDKGQCLGCFRTRDERLNWLSFDAANRQKVIKRCQQRKKRKNKPSKVVDAEVIAEPIQPSLLDPPSKPKFDESDEIDFGDFEL